MYGHFLFLHNGLICILPLKAKFEFWFWGTIFTEYHGHPFKNYTSGCETCKQEPQRPSWPSVLILNPTGQIINVLKTSTVSTRVQSVQGCSLVGIYYYEYIYHLFIVNLSHHLNIFIKNNNLLQVNGNRITKI